MAQGEISQISQRSSVGLETSRLVDRLLATTLKPSTGLSPLGLELTPGSMPAPPPTAAAAAPPAAATSTVMNTPSSVLDAESVVGVAPAQSSKKLQTSFSQLGDFSRVFSWLETSKSAASSDHTALGASAASDSPSGLPSSESRPSTNLRKVAYPTTAAGSAFDEFFGIDSSPPPQRHRPHQDHHHDHQHEYQHHAATYVSPADFEEVSSIKRPQFYPPQALFDAGPPRHANLSNGAQLPGHETVTFTLPWNPLQKNRLAIPCPPVEERQRTVLGKMMAVYDQDRKLPAHTTVHVFVDMSNILIGFFRTVAQAYGLPTAARFSPPPTFNFEIFAQIMERSRKVVKRAAVGSMNPKHSRPPPYFADAERAGFTIDIRKRIPKSLDNAQPGKQQQHPGFEYSSDDSAHLAKANGSRPGSSPMREDRVDEAIHLQMSESMLDAVEPGVIVLATGDAAAAEASGGFLKFVERALARGWRVELVAWKHSTSSLWTAKTFRRRWGSSFTIIELDSFTTELFGGSD